MNARQLEAEARPFQAQSHSPSPGLIVREREPENLEFPFFALNSATTPTEQFFVRSHFPVPKIDLQAWRLKVEGQVNRPLEFSFDELTRFPTHTTTSRRDLRYLLYNRIVVSRSPSLVTRLSESFVDARFD